MPRRLAGVDARPGRRPLRPPGRVERSGPPARVRGQRPGSSPRWLGDPGPRPLRESRWRPPGGSWPTWAPTWCWSSHRAASAGPAGPAAGAGHRLERGQPALPRIRRPVSDRSPWTWPPSGGYELLSAVWRPAARRGARQRRRRDPAPRLVLTTTPCGPSTSGSS